MAFDAGYAMLLEYLSALDTLLIEPLNEADTRVKFIDPILTGVLGWDEKLHIRRELRYEVTEDKEPVEKESAAGAKNRRLRAIDYVLSLPTPILVVEAKSELVHFELPNTTERRFRLDAGIQECKTLWAAITQCRNYCSDEGATFALVTNGRQWVGFKALVERGKWTNANAIAYRTADELKTHFAEFYQCFSRETISQQRLTELTRIDDLISFRARPNSRIGAIDGQYRNKMYDLLETVFTQLLLDTPDEPSREFLEQCYCRNDTVLKYGMQLQSVITDNVPTFKGNIQPIKTGVKSDRFSGAIAQLAQKSSQPPLLVVMGGPGVGKTTFLQWFFKVRGAVARHKDLGRVQFMPNVRAEFEHVRAAVSGKRSPY